MYISGAKLEEHCSNISGDYLSGTAPHENPYSFAVLPFVNGATKPLTRIPRRHDTQVVNKPLKSLQQEFPSPSFKSSIEHQPNVVYKIPCMPIVITAMWAKPTGVLKLDRKKERTKKVKTCPNVLNIAKHAWSFDHRIDFDNSMIVISLTKALLALLKPCRLGTPLLPSMLTIILSGFQTSIADSKPIMYSLCTSPLGVIAQYRHMNFHLCADDTQL